ncbi:hypothetical protein [Algicola sagamiensis]|uniref:hypothetical protein n=1 Tax=Algicola sagamiensis TaxID=163869 RepID=UPI00037B7146|nr:hypothetical protein [Algicola sagamiensis]
MSYIKKKIQSEESESISNRDGGMGIIMFGLAMAVIFDKLAAHPMFPNNKYAKKYARKIDYFFALMILILLSISFFGMTVFYICK